MGWDEVGGMREGGALGCGEEMEGWDGGEGLVGSGGGRGWWVPGGRVWWVRGEGLVGSGEGLVGSGGGADGFLGRPGGFGGRGWWVRGKGWWVRAKGWWVRVEGWEGVRRENILDHINVQLKDKRKSCWLMPSVTADDMCCLFVSWANYGAQIRMLTSPEWVDDLGSHCHVRVG